ERIFGLFVQARQPAGGLGIGLALVHRIVRMHNGTITAASEGRDRGSTFTVRLPLVSSGSARRHERAAEPSSAAIVPIKVMVIDDNVDSVDAMARLLRSMVQDVRACYSGGEALAIASELKPDLVFVDVTMPDINGLEVIAAMRAQPWSEHARICALSGHGQAADQRRSSTAGAHMHIVKP